MLEKLRVSDFRITPQRHAVLSILAASQEHPSVDQIYKEVKAQFPTTSLATVYKTVSLLKELERCWNWVFMTATTGTTATGHTPTPMSFAQSAKR